MTLTSEKHKFWVRISIILRILLCKCKKAEKPETKTEEVAVTPKKENKMEEPKKKPYKKLLKFGKSGVRKNISKQTMDKIFLSDINRYQSSNKEEPNSGMSLQREVLEEAKSISNHSSHKSKLSKKSWIE